MPENLTNKNQRQTTNFTTHQQKKKQFGMFFARNL